MCIYAIMLFMISERLRNIFETRGNYLRKPQVVKVFGILSTSLLIACSPATGQDQAIELAKKVYAEKKAQGMDFTNGPCLSNDLMPDWVADVAHKPRQPIDDLPQNQCPAFGKTARHFVELNPQGEFIRAH